MTMPQPTIAVIGAGFSGTALSLWLQSSCPVGTRIYLIERGHRFAAGRAYATENPSHLLNVPAGRMSMFPDLPQDFVRWLRQQPKSRLANVVPSESAFVPRSLFGAYIQDRLAASLCDTRASRLELLHDEVVRAEEHAEKVTLHLASGAKLDADIAVLASGNAHPLPVHSNVAVLDAAGLWRGNPWTPAALVGLAPDTPVLLVGSGLTMVDTVVTLLDAGHTGPIHALSRNGLLPHGHALPEIAPVTLPTPLPTGLAPLMRFVRSEIARSQAAGTDWRPVIDALRPFTQNLWHGLSVSERGRFLRHLRAFWDVHRHRIPPTVADRIQAALASKQLHIHAGRIVVLGVEHGRANVTFRERMTGAERSLQAACVIDCTGPGADVTQSTDPLMQTLLRAGIARPDPLRLGLDVAADGAVLTRSSAPSSRLFAIGPLTKGASWEMTAVQELRTQCRDLARGLAKRLVQIGQSDGQPATSPTGDTAFRGASFRKMKPGKMPHPQQINLFHQSLLQT
jgi:uncharacterized NAD(P)/FAD-binding protein YdhS